MGGIRIGKKWNVAWQPTTTIWYDYLSGDDSATDGDFETFNTLFDTGHKYYGFMDLFLPGNGAGTDFLGLQDLAFKFSVKPMPKLTAKADLHIFWTAEEATVGTASGSAAAVTSGNLASGEDLLGQELDLTLKYAYNPFVAITLGYSHFFADDLMGFVGPRDTAVPSSPGSPITETISTGAEDSDWAYVMFDVKF